MMLGLVQDGAGQAVEHVSPEVTGPVTALFTFILVAMIVSLALEEKIHAKKSLIVGLFALVSLLLGAILLPLPFGPYVVGGHEIAMPVFIPQSIGGCLRSSWVRASLSM